MILLYTPAQAVLDVLVPLVRGCESGGLPEVFITDVFPCVVQRVLNSDDSSVLQVPARVWEGGREGVEKGGGREGEGGGKVGGRERREVRGREEGRLGEGRGGKLGGGRREGWGKGEGEGREIGGGGRRKEGDERGLWRRLS